jgi:O-antigen/teichoic acid export membrane protein
MSEAPTPPDGPAATATPTLKRVGLARNAFYLILGQVASTALAIVFNGALGRSLGARDFGLYFLISSFAAFAFVAVDWGQQFYAVREIARAPERAGDLLGTGLVLRLAGTLIICVPIGLAAWALGYDHRTRWYSVVYVLISLPQLLLVYFGIVFRGRDRMSLDALTTVVNKAVALVLALATLAFGLGLAGVVLAQTVAACVALAAAARLYRQVATGPVRFSTKTAREMLTGGTSLAAGQLAVYVQPYIDAVFISKMVSSEGIGWYGAAKNIMGTLFTPPFILGAAAFPRLSQAAADPAAFKREFETALRPTLWLGGLAGVGTCLFADTAIHVVYGHRQFGPAADILRVFGPGLFLFSIDVLLGNCLNALGRAGAFSAAKVASVVVSTALEVVLIPYFQRRSGNGGVGAVLAFVLSEIVVFSGSVLLMPRGSVGRPLLVNGSRALGAAVLTAVFFHEIPELPAWLGIPLCVVAFSVLSVVVRLVTREDLEMFRAMVRERMARGAQTRTPGQSESPAA